MIEQNTNKIKIIENLKNAVINNDHKEVENILVQNETLNINLEINDIPLIMYAAQHSYWDVFNELYSAGANINAKIETMKWSLIHECIMSAPEKFTKALIQDQDLDLNVQNKNGLTPLMLAIKEKKSTIIKEILNQGRFDISKVDKNQNNVGHYAVINEDYDLLVTLINKKCSINQKNKDDETPYDLINDLQVKESLDSRVLKKEKNNDNEDKISITPKVSVEIKKEEISTLSGLSKIKRK